MISKTGNYNAGIVKYGNYSSMTSYLIKITETAIIIIKITLKDNCKVSSFHAKMKLFDEITPRCLDYPVWVINRLRPMTRKPAKKMKAGIFILKLNNKS